MLDTVQDNQRKMERRQIQVESSVRGIQSDISKLSKSHSSTSGTVTKLLDKSRKVGSNVKEMRERLDRQSLQVKRLEANQTQLLKKNNFRVLIFQISNVSTVSDLEETTQECSPDAPPASLELSSDEEAQAGGEAHEEEKVEKLEQSRAAKIKRSSLRKVDSIKKAFSRENFEKRMNRFGTKIVSPERREKIKKSLTPSNQKTQSLKASSFKVSPMTFNVKKVREGEATPKSPKRATACCGGGGGRSRAKIERSGRGLVTPNNNLHLYKR
uniref:Caveolae associated protein 2b n=1 Tax=Callorhinchus milii TaxID=7868 RepID=A0A4W3J577_CALMI